MEFTLLGAAFVAVATVWLFIYLEAPRGNAAVICDRGLWDIAVTAAVVGVFVGRFWAVVASGGNPLTAPADLLIIRSGVATGPATVAALATLAWMTRDNVLALADAIAPAALAGLSGWHASCLIREGCLGTTTELPWAMFQSGSSVGRHPVELYASILLGVAAIALVVYKARGSRLPPGVIASSVLGLAAGIRLLTEPLRPSLGGGPVAWYWVGLAASIAAIVWLLRTRSDERSKSTVHSPT
ncbi:MAG: prolipoprotein diacylglyceryl transferase [Acidimicrobiia bacterium]|nr:prolipoprotein diacylglyceryl transferase [Acidimicrobiia bacterium]